MSYSKLIITQSPSSGIDTKLLKNVDRCKNPRMHGKGLICNRSGEWRYRVGDYRAFCEIRDGERVVLVLEIGHRRDIYEN